MVPHCNLPFSSNINWFFLSSPSNCCFVGVVAVVVEKVVGMVVVFMLVTELGIGDGGRPPVVAGFLSLPFFFFLPLAVVLAPLLVTMPGSRSIMGRVFCVCTAFTQSCVFYLHTNTHQGGFALSNVEQALHNTWQGKKVKYAVFRSLIILLAGYLVYSCFAIGASSRILFATILALLGGRL